MCSQITPCTSMATSAITTLLIASLLAVRTATTARCHGLQTILSVSTLTTQPTAACLCREEPTATPMRKLHAAQMTLEFARAAMSATTAGLWATLLAVTLLKACADASQAMTCSMSARYPTEWHALITTMSCAVQTALTAATHGHAMTLVSGSPRMLSAAASKKISVRSLSETDALLSLTASVVLTAVNATCHGRAPTLLEQEALLPIAVARAPGEQRVFSIS